MHEKNTPGVPGQETDSSTPASIAEIITLLRSIGARLEVLEKRFEDLAVSGTAEAELEPPRIPTLALTSDGRLLISVHYLSERAIEGRETWTGVLLTEAEACDAFDALSDAADGAAAHVGGRIIAQARKKAESEGEGGDETV
jgi:hypothetical protein